MKWIFRDSRDGRRKHPAQITIWLTREEADQFHLGGEPIESQDVGRLLNLLDLAAYADD